MDVFEILLLVGWSVIGLCSITSVIWLATVAHEMDRR